MLQYLNCLTFGLHTPSIEGGVSSQIWFGPYLLIVCTTGKSFLSFRAALQKFCDNGETVTVIRISAFVHFSRHVCSLKHLT